MFVHLLQAIVIAVLFMFPFVYDVNDFTTNHKTANICATVDSALMKYYSQTGILPQKLDAETLKKLGLDEKSAEGMTYEKLEDRKFVLSYEDAKDNVNESIHSRTLLPVNVNTSFGEIKEIYHFIEVDETPNQKVTVTVTYPDGSVIIIDEGHKMEVPAKSQFEVTIVPDEGWVAGSPNVSKGSVIKDLAITVSPAEIKTFDLSVENCVNQDVLIKVEDINNGNTFNISQNQSVDVGYGTKFSLLSITPIAGYKAGSITPSNGVVNANTVIKVVDAVKNNDCNVSVENVKNQIITCYIYDSNQNDRLITLTNGDSYTVGYNSRYEVKIEPFKDFTAGTLNVAAKGNVVSDMTITATPAEKDEPPAPPEEDIGDGWVPIRPVYYTPGYSGHGTPLDKDQWFNYDKGVGQYWGEGEGYRLMIKIPKGVNKILFCGSSPSTPEDIITLTVFHPSYAPINGWLSADHMNFWFIYGQGFRGLYTKEANNINLEHHHRDNYKKYYNTLPGNVAEGRYVMYSLIQVVPEACYIIAVNTSPWSWFLHGFYYNRKYQHIPAGVVDLLTDVPANEIPDSLK